MRPGKRKAPNKENEVDALIDQGEKLKTGIRAKVEHPFRVIKRQFGFVKVLRPSLAGCRGRRCAAADQFADLVGQDFVVNDIEQAAPTVLAAAAISPGYGSLLVHVPENCKVILTGGRYADLGVVEIRTRAALEAKDRAVPFSRCGDGDRTGLVQAVVPAFDLCGRRGRIDLRVRPPSGGPQRNTAQLGRHQLPRRYSTCSAEGFEISPTPLESWTLVMDLLLDFFPRLLTRA